jgi:hypothetical protein
MHLKVFNARGCAHTHTHTHRFPVLQRQLAASVLDFIRSGADPAERMIGSLIECEHDFINCDHPGKADQMK